MVSTELEEAYMDLQLSTEDIVLQTASMLRKRYNAMMRKVLDVIALWWIHNDIQDLKGAQANIDELMAELDGVIDPESADYIEDMTMLFAEVYAFNYAYAKRLEYPEEEEEEHTILLMLGATALLKAWAEDGLTYNERMIKRSENMKNAIKAIVLRSSAMGWSSKRMLAEVKKEMDKSKYRGTGVLVDESNHFANEAVKDALQDDFDGYEVSAILDMKTCATCRSMHRKRFTWDEYDIGITAPMFHNSCRCRIIPIGKKQ